MARKKAGSCLYVCYSVDKKKRKCFSTKEKANTYLRSNKGTLCIEPCDTETLRSLQALEANRGEW